jgi:hypothetical protein
MWNARSAYRRLAFVLLAGVLVACGGGGGGGDGLTPGAYWTGIDVGTRGCGAEIHEAMGGDVTMPSSNRIRLVLNIAATADCPATAMMIEGTQTGPGTWDMDNYTGSYVCALDREYGYQIFDLTNGTIVQRGSDYELDCDFSAESGGTICDGWFHVYMEPR